MRADSERAALELNAVEDLVYGDTAHARKVRLQGNHSRAIYWEMCAQARAFRYLDACWGN